MSEDTNGRGSQLVGGFKTGLKKGTVRAVSSRIAGAAAAKIPFNEKLPVKELVEPILLTFTAEVVQRAPDGVASKIGMNEDRRTQFSNLCRTIAGEALGKNAADLFKQIAPAILDKISDLTKEDILDEVNRQDVEEEELLEQTL